MTLRWKPIKVPPGVSVAIMATATFLYTLIPPELLTATSKRLWIVGICLLGVAEIFAIYRANREQIQENQNRFDLMMERFEQVQSASAMHQQSMARLLQVINDPVESLKKKAFQLSEQILNFILARIQTTPVVKPARKTSMLPIVLQPSHDGDDWVQEMFEHRASMEALSRYQRATLDLFKYRFADRALAIRNELRNNGITDQLLDDAIDRTVSAQDIQMIGERIGDLASRIGEGKVSAAESK